MNKVEIKGKKLGHSVEEAYKTLRTNLQFCGEDKKVIAVTSCTPNEGKSNVTLNLARAVAEAGKKVLVVDADLRRSVMMGITEVTQEIKGLSHFLTKQCKMADVICATNIRYLHIVYAGPPAPNPAELLGNKYFEGLIQTCREVYDYILIDTPPLGSVIDSAVIASQCDGYVIVIESGVISYRFVKEIKEQLEKSDCPILGAILNKVDTSSRRYSGKYYGKYYGKYRSKYYGKYNSYDAYVSEYSASTVSIENAQNSFSDKSTKASKE